MRIRCFRAEAAVNGPGGGVTSTQRVYSYVSPCSPPRLTAHDLSDRPPKPLAYDWMTRTPATQTPVGVRLPGARVKLPIPQISGTAAANPDR